jgi:hypothetical protein
MGANMSITWNGEHQRAVLDSTSVGPARNALADIVHTLRTYWMILYDPSEIKNSASHIKEKFYGIARGRGGPGSGIR